MKLYVYVYEILLFYFINHLVFRYFFNHKNRLNCDKTYILYYINLIKKIIIFFYLVKIQLIQ